MTERPTVRIAIELVVEIDRDAFEEHYQGSSAYNQAGALAHVMEMFEADRRGTSVTTVVSLEATDPETGEPVDEHDVWPV